LKQQLVVYALILEFGFVIRFVRLDTGTTTVLFDTSASNDRFIGTGFFSSFAACTALLRFFNGTSHITRSRDALGVPTVLSSIDCAIHV
jgi:hypothetical protein